MKGQTQERILLVCNPCWKSLHWHSGNKDLCLAQETPQCMHSVSLQTKHIRENELNRLQILVLFRLIT